jgi:hypothetical protein
MVRKDTSHDIFINIDAEGLFDLLGDPGATEARVAPLFIRRWPV